MSEDLFDVVIIGAGPGGEATAAHLAKAGLKVAVVERELVGGECPYWGCMPSKALLRPEHIRKEALRTPGVAEQIIKELDVEAVLARRDEVIRNLSDASHTERIERHGIEIIRGHGRISGELKVEVELTSGGMRDLVANKAIVLAPGTYAAIPPIEGLSSVEYWTNREATLAKEIPATLAILGGGVIGVELAQAFASLGSKVTILEPGNRLLGREEAEAAALIQQSLENDGVEVMLGVGANKVHSSSTDHKIVIDLSNQSTIEVDKLLVATGRQGATHDLGLESVGVTPDKRGNIDVLRCMHHKDVPWLYVVGDANGRAQLTHAATYQARVAARNIAGLPTDCVEDSVGAPRVVFTEPNVAAVGHTLDSAINAGINAKAFDRDPQQTAAGSFTGRGTKGFARLVVDMDSGCIVGATFVAAEIAELLHSATIAIVGAVPIERLRHCVAPFPTRSEVWVRLVELLDRDPILQARR